MFSENQKISIRQSRRLLILDLFGASSLLLPGLLAKNVGTDGIFCMIIAFLLLAAYLWLLGYILKQVQQDYCGWIRKTIGNVVGDILLIFYLFFFLLLAAFLLYQLSGLVETWLLPEQSYGWLYALILLPAAYATKGGIEGRARIYEILFWFLGVPLLIMLFLAAREVNVDYWTPIAHSSLSQLWSGSILVLSFFLPVLFVPFMWKHCSHPEKLTACARRAMGVAVVLNIVIYLILVGNFQVKTTAVLERPVITLMSMVKLPGEFFARMDAFMIAIWFFSLFALMNTGIYYASHILKDLFHEKKTHYGLVVILIMVYSASRWFREYSGAIAAYSWYIRWVALPFMLGLPILLWIVCRLFKRKDYANA